MAIAMVTVVTSIAAETSGEDSLEPIGEKREPNAEKEG